MEFTNPTEVLQSSLKRFQRLAMILGVVLGISILVPLSLRKGPYIIFESETHSRLAKSEPWMLTVSRLEGFTRHFLDSRFSWNSDTFSMRASQLEVVTDKKVFSKLKDSLQSYRLISSNQKARCYYVLESTRFSNEDQIAEAIVTRVIRIGGLAIATPLIVRIKFREATLSKSNPYGLVVSSLEEVQPGEKGRG